MTEFNSQLDEAKEGGIKRLGKSTTSPRRPVRMRLEAICRTLIMLFLGGMIVWHAAVLVGSRYQLSQAISDFVSFYSAGQAVRRGLGPELYSQKTLTRLQDEVAPLLVQQWHGPLPYIHPPFEAAIFAPFAALPYPAAFGVWDLVSVSALFVAILLLSSCLPRLRLWSSALPFLCAFAFLPVLVCLLRGQDSAILFLFMVCAYVAMRHHRDFAAGMCLGLALIKFQIVLGLIAILLLKRKWHLAFGFALTTIALTMASAAVVGWDATIHYPHTLILLSQSQTHLTMNPDNMPNLRGAIERVLGEGGMIINVVLALASVASILFVARRCNFDPDRAGFALEFSLALTVSLLISYHLGTQDLILLLLPLLLVSEALFEHTIGRPASSVLVAAVVLIFLNPVYLLLAAIHSLEGGYFWTAALLTVGITLGIFQGQPAPAFRARGGPASREKRLWPDSASGIMNRLRWRSNR